MEFVRKTFFDSYRSEFGPFTQKQVDGIDLLLTFIEQDEKFTTAKVSVQQQAYFWATVLHETARTMQPIDEYGSFKYFEKMYGPDGDNPKRAVTMGNKVPGDGNKFHGRGYVQLTWYNNYYFAGKKLGVNLIDNPELVKIPGNAYKVAVMGMRGGWFTGKKLDDFIHPALCDYVEARRIINGKDKAGLIAGYAVTFQDIIERSIK